MKRTPEENEMLASIINHSNRIVSDTSWLVREKLDQFIIDHNGEVITTTNVTSFAKSAALFNGADIIDRQDIRSYRSRTDQLRYMLAHGMKVAA